MLVCKENSSLDGGLIITTITLKKSYPRHKLPPPVPEDRVAAKCGAGSFIRR